MSFRIVEKRNPQAVHGIFTTYHKAKEFLEKTVPSYISRGYYDDKTLTVNDFCVVPAQTRREVAP